MKDGFQFVAAVRDLTVAALAKRESALLECRLQARAGIDRKFKDGRETSEIHIEFLRDDELVDFLETHVLQEGKPAITLTEFEKWLEECIDDIIRTARDDC